MQSYGGHAKGNTNRYGISTNTINILTGRVIIVSTDKVDQSQTHCHKVIEYCLPFHLYIYIYIYIPQGQFKRYLF